MSTSTSGLRCPLGHGEYAAGSALFCMTCGARLVPFSGPGPRAAVHTPMVSPGTAPAAACATCGGTGRGLPEHTLVCPTCRWLRPLTPGYALHPSAFMWAQDAAAMARLRAIGPLTAAARGVSDRVGRRWVEAQYNAIRLGENQLPETYAQAIEAARLLAMPSMPEVYVSGDRMWDAITYGSDNSAFVIIGTALVGAFRGPEMLFVLAREMGHCRAGHALWKTVGTFLLGQQGPRRSAMAGGVLAALNPQKIVEGALDIPLLAWARQSEITADRAGLLAIGDEEVARRVLLSWSLKSVGLYRQINTDAWLAQQQDDSEDHMTRLAEMVTSPTPFITSRLSLLARFAHGPEMQRARAYIAQAAGSRSVAPQDTAAAPAAGPKRPSAPSLRVQCPHCSTALRVATSALAGRDSVVLRCPNPACRKPVPLRKRGPRSGPAPAPPPAAVAPAPVPALRVTCPACGVPMSVPRQALADAEIAAVRCANGACRRVMRLRLRPTAAAEQAATNEEE